MKKEFAHIAYKNILKHWRKSLITGICICLGFTGIILLGGYLISMERYLTVQGIYLNHTGHIALYQKGGLERYIVEPQEFSFSVRQQLKVMETVQAHPKVERLIPFIHGQGLLTSGCKSFPVLVWASEPQDEKYLRTHPVVLKEIPLLIKLKNGQGFWDSNVPNGILITTRLAELLGKPLVSGDQNEKKELEDSIITDCRADESDKTIAAHSGIQFLGNNFEGGLAASDASVIGHFSTGFSLSEDSSALMPLGLAHEFFATKRITSYGIFLKDTEDTAEVLKWLKRESKKWNFLVDLYPYRTYEVNPFYVGSMRFMYVLFLFFLIIVCGVVILSLLNAIQIAIMERKSEIGTLLAMGYRRSHIRHLFELESIILAIASLSFGAIISWLLCHLINSFEFQFDIVGNADRLILKLAIEWWFTLIFIIFFLFFTYIATSLICRFKLNIPVIRLLERVD